MQEKKSYFKNMASRLIKDLHPKILPLFNDFRARMKKSGIEIVVTCTWRSADEQAVLFAQGREKRKGIWTVKDGKKIVTWLMAGQSAHNYMLAGKPAACAFDIAIIRDGKLNWDPESYDWRKARECGAAAGLRNLYPKESAHFEYPDWRSLDLVKKSS